MSRRKRSQDPGSATWYSLAGCRSLKDCPERTSRVRHTRPSAEPLRTHAAGSRSGASLADLRTYRSTATGWLSLNSRDARSCHANHLLPDGSTRLLATSPAAECSALAHTVLTRSVTSAFPDGLTERSATEQASPSGLAQLAHRTGASLPSSISIRSRPARCQLPASSSSASNSSRRAP